jgi:hypothetical protein
MMNAEFSRRAVIMAKVCADWGAGNLFLTEHILEPMRDHDARRFIEEIHAHLRHMEEAISS